MGSIRVACTGCGYTWILPDHARGIDRPLCSVCREARETPLGKFTEFTGRHGHTVTNAMQVYVDSMREEARNARAAYDAIKDDPAKTAAQDKTIVTTLGFLHMSRAFTEAADRCERALNAWQELTGEDDDEDEPETFGAEDDEPEITSKDYLGRSTT